MSGTTRRPVSTYRLQFDRRFQFADARELLPYLDELGVTDCYSSPQLQARPGSTHGYDICDHSRLNQELGSEDEYAGFCDALHARGFGHIVDIVPNHMSCDPSANPWWRDVLENGPSSPYAAYFDIDWDPIKPELKGKVLLPVLGDQYGQVLERGELQLRFEDGSLHLHYFDRDFPINPRQAPRVLGRGVDRLERELAGDPALREFLSILTALQNLPPYTERDAIRIVERQREKEVARERLVRLVNESSTIRDHVDSSIRAANGTRGERASFDLLHALLEHQAYRLAYWRTAFDEINYRRFFDINELVGLRMEQPEVFEATHGLVRQLIGSGRITGLRVDHPDGLFDPTDYFRRLQQMARDARGGALDGDRDEPLYVVAEKILSRDEALRTEWPIAGTTGYAFVNLVSGLFVDGRHATTLRRVYARMTGRQRAFEQVAYQSKLTIMLTAMASELNVLAHALNRISEGDRRVRDFTLNSCRKVLREVIACFPVYRTYISARGVDAFDREVIQEAIRRARQRNPLMEVSIFEFVQQILLATPDSSTTADARSERLHFAMKVQQFTAPVQAKGVEDTAFYRYDVLIAANEVGGSPARLGVTATEFHDANSRRLALWPTELITTATHDTKRGEDARMRLAVLSEIPEAWRRAVSEWMRINGRHRSKLGGVWAPDRNDEYLFYQTLIGAWPAEPPPAPMPRRAPEEVVRRVSAYMQKAAREAKVHTSWIDEDQAYGRAVSRFVEETLAGSSSARFLHAFLPFQRRVAHVGMINSLAQLVLKLASPGTSDFFQGGELWDLSLVDPDNRCPVDFAHRQRLLDELRPLIASLEQGVICGEAFGELLAHWADGRVKLFTTTCGLRFRRRHAEVVLDGAYVPLEPRGPAAEHVVAFARHHAAGTLVAAVPRLTASLTAEASPLPLGETSWGTTQLPIPDTLAGRPYRHLLTGEVIRPDPGAVGCALPVAAIFHASPAALLWAPSSQPRP